MKNKIRFYHLTILAILTWNCETKSPDRDVDTILPLLVTQNQDIPSAVIGTNDSNEAATNVSYQEGVWLADVATDAPGHTGSGFQDKTKAINGVRGAGIGAGSTDVYSLQYLSATPNDYIVLEWSGNKITNGPGIDFIVFENGFRVTASPVNYFMDMIIVELSNDQTNWCGFNPNYTFTPETTYSKDPAHWSGFAGRMPVLFHESTNNFGYDPKLVFNTANSGGDAFDLDHLSDVNNSAGGSGCSSTLKEELKKGFTYIRLSSASSNRWKNPDTGVAFVREAISNGPDIDGVYARYKISR